MLVRSFCHKFYDKSCNCADLCTQQHYRVNATFAVYAFVSTASTVRPFSSFRCCFRSKSIRGKNCSLRQHWDGWHFLFFAIKQMERTDGIANTMSETITFFIPMSGGGGGGKKKIPISFQKYILITIQSFSYQSIVYFTKQFFSTNVVKISHYKISNYLCNFKTISFSRRKILATQ